MVRKTDSPAKRARQLLYRVDKEPAQKSLMQLRAEIGAPPESRSDAWYSDARIALTLEKMTSITLDGVQHPVPPDILDLQYETLRRAFAHFKLDPASPLDWRLLLTHLADIYFGPRMKKKRGAPKKWTAQAYEKLNSELVAKKLNNIPATRAGKRLVVEMNAGKEALRKRIGVIRRKTATKKVGTNR